MFHLTSNQHIRRNTPCKDLFKYFLNPRENKDSGYKDGVFLLNESSPPKKIAISINVNDSITHATARDVAEFFQFGGGLPDLTLEYKDLGDNQLEDLRHLSPAQLKSSLNTKEMHLTLSTMIVQAPGHFYAVAHTKKPSEDEDGKIESKFVVYDRQNNRNTTTTLSDDDMYARFFIDRKGKNIPHVPTLLVFEVSVEATEDLVSISPVDDDTQDESEPQAKRNRTAP